MTTRRTWIQLAVFALVTVAAVCYGSVRYLGAGQLVSRPYQVEAVFERSGGIYPRADVDLLGTRVGRVAEVRPGEEGTTVVVLALDADTRVPRDLTATIASKSAIGEQVVELAPRTAGGPVLEEGDVIPVERTVAPPDMGQLLADLDGLVASLPRRDLATVLEEGSAALSGLAPSLGRLVDDADTLTTAALQGVDDLTALLRNANVVLGTQVDLGPQTSESLAALATLTRTLEGERQRLLDLFGFGARATGEGVALLQAVRVPFAGVVASLVRLVGATSRRVPELRKAFTLFPTAIEFGATAIRPCHEYDARTGRPIASTCRYDEQGRPIFSGHLAMQLPEDPGAPPYAPCRQGYEGTVRHLPNGTPVGGGRKQRPDSEPNLDARCTASPTDPRTPNVRGAQNVV
ncbi:MAG TPA: MlaD family protein [Nocardioidaceae bacterium]|nr:MlaD family protein [Nocardioidaceae bacterium]